VVLYCVCSQLGTDWHSEIAVMSERNTNAMAIKRAVARARLTARLRTLSSHEVVTREIMIRAGIPTHWIFISALGVPWLEILTVHGGWKFKVDEDLYEICEGLRKRPELGGQSVAERLQELQGLRHEIIKRRKANREKDTLWQPDQIVKVEQSKLLNYIEETLDKLSTGLMRSGDKTPHNRPK
jgi:hypothetical protein